MKWFKDFHKKSKHTTMSTIADSQDPKASEPIMVPTDTAIKLPTPDESHETLVPNSEFSRANIEALGGAIRLTDKDPCGLELLHYVRCTSKDPVLIQQCRGVVFHGEEVVVRAFPYCKEFNHEDIEELETHIHPKFKHSIFYDAHEGATIRMFHFDGRWFTSTHRKLNAFRSKWASRESFGTTFKRALEVEVSENSVLRNSIPSSEEGLLERFQTTLDKTKQYMFLVRHSSENRIVCDAPRSQSGEYRPTLYHIGTFVDGELTMTENINVPYPKKHKFINVDELKSYVQGIDIRHLQGVICFAPNNEQYKIYNKDYQDLFRARGNEPSIKFQYLKVRMNRPDVDKLYFLYPDFGKHFDEIENTLFDIATNIYKAYVQRFIKKRFVTVPNEDFQVIKACHQWHEEDRASNRISVDKVIEVLNRQQPTALNKMLRRFRSEKEAKDETKNVTRERARSNTISSSPALAPVSGTPPVASPLLLAASRGRSHASGVPPSPLGPPAVNPEETLHQCSITASQ